MWGGFHWGRKEEAAEGVVVVFAWLWSGEKYLDQYVKFYGSLGWNSLVCHADFLTLYFPEKATSLANSVLEELVKEVKMRSLPIVFAAFSGGSKICMYKVLQIIDGKVEGKLNVDDFHLVRDCFCGQIYDSSPIDFTNDLGARFVRHPGVLKMSQPSRAALWMAKAMAPGLDTLFLNKFEEQRAEYWEALYSSVNLGPFLIFCSEDDELAPYPVICKFAQYLQELGGDVKVVKWICSHHIGHYKRYQDEYKAAVTELLGKAVILYCGRINQLNKNGMDRTCNQVSKSVYNPHEEATNPNDSLRRVAIDPSNDFFLPSSLDNPDAKDECSIQDEQKGGLFDTENLPGINAHGVLGMILFDVCVPKNIDGWDVKPSAMRQSLPYGRFNPAKFICRSKL